MDEAGWQMRWQAQRWFITADGEADKLGGTRQSDGTRTRAASRSSSLCPSPIWPTGLMVATGCLTRSAFPYRGDEVAAQAASGAVRYHICYQPDRHKWYLDASCKPKPPPGRPTWTSCTGAGCWPST